MGPIGRYYNFDGLRISISSSVAVSEALHSRLKPLSVTEEGTADFVFDISLISDDESHIVERPPGSARPVYGRSAGEVLYFEDTEQIYIDYADRVRVLCDFGDERVRISARRAETDNLWLVSHPMFTLPLM